MHISGVAEHCRLQPVGKDHRCDTVWAVIRNWCSLHKIFPIKLYLQIIWAHWWAVGEDGLDNRTRSVKYYLKFRSRCTHRILSEVPGSQALNTCPQGRVEMGKSELCLLFLCIWFWHYFIRIDLINIFAENCSTKKLKPQLSSILPRSIKTM